MCYRESWFEEEARRKARQRREEEQKAAEPVKPAAPIDRPQVAPETRKPKETEREPELV